jgi:hypothetical protein
METETDPEKRRVIECELAEEELSWTPSGSRARRMRAE